MKRKGEKDGGSFFIFIKHKCYNNHIIYKEVRVKLSLYKTTKMYRGAVVQFHVFLTTLEG
jgi:hypothetical protein